MRRIYRGAEATIDESEGLIIKQRVPKTYRIPALDQKLRKSRTKREAKMLNLLETLSFPSPRVINVDDREMKIIMTLMPGQTVKSMSDNLLQASLFLDIGKCIGRLHTYDIIHGDLTTSNMLYDAEQSSVTEHGLSFIDFGLSYISQRVEDKAVELHLLFDSMRSGHYRVSDLAIENILMGYEQTYPASDSVLDRLVRVEKRGRYKQKKKEK